jgi:hypothetical protein
VQAILQKKLTVVAAVHHERVDETLNNGHPSLGELLLGVTASSVGCSVSLA